MQLGRVVGTCVATRKVESLRGQKLLIVQPLSFELVAEGPAVIAVDVVRAGRGELVFFVRSREAANSLPDPFTPVDAACVGIVDDLGMLASIPGGPPAKSTVKRRPTASRSGAEAGLVWLSGGEGEA